MNLIRWIKERTSRGPLRSSHDVAVELARARRADEKIANHRPMRTTDATFDPRNGTSPTP